MRPLHWWDWWVIVLVPVYLVASYAAVVAERWKDWKRTSIGKSQE